MAQVKNNKDWKRCIGGYKLGSIEVMREEVRETVGKAYKTQHEEREVCRVGLPGTSER